MRAPVPAVILLALAACSASGDEAEGEAAARGETIACATGGAAELAPVCTVERAVEDGALILIIHHEDGGFRRLAVQGDGSGVAAADGADPAQITVYDGEIAVTVAADRYILPATIAGRTGETAGDATP
ncbi:hypothetical protein [Altererythrobacter lauratis]|uniref:Lipoprotein n=1 Tax=Alteraurantiacibacter lauratis TaxID=2054627 RepID=A0ABV7EDC0_9SPHN